ncbi:MAG: cupin domain-containing protein [Ignavibacteriaceae bacterium]|jgi:predicted cupin superfamily sugar epimerase
MSPDAQKYIEKLQLKPHPEGGYFKEIYRAGEMILPEHLPKRYKSSRNFSTSIYFLLEGNQVSNFHRLKSDEQWHFYDGSSIALYVIDERGNLNKILLGRNVESGESLQTVIKQNSWFAAELSDKTSFALIGCTVTPGFDFSDFELSKRIDLIEAFPQYRELIDKLTKL